MLKLLHAEFKRLSKSTVFKLGLLFAAGLAVFLILTRWTDGIKYPEYAPDYDDALFISGILLTFASAAFVSIFIGTEFSDGAIRNKLIVGHSRGAVYLSKLVVCTVGTICMILAYTVTLLLLGWLLIGAPGIRPTAFFLLLGLSLLASVTYTALLTAITMALQNKAVAAVVCLLLTVVMMFGSSYIASRLEAPEYYKEAYRYDTESGQLVKEEREKNPYYITGTVREVFTFFDEYLPFGQLYRVSEQDATHTGMLVLYDAINLVLFTGAGIVIFKKRNLK